MDAEARDFLRGLAAHIYVKLLTVENKIGRVEAAELAIEAAEIFVEKFATNVDGGD